ncbi:phytanoyl-CoA dioxygenase family protein [Terasakiella sp. SH-1]|uniref:phytanoyl-CoA dioxygenase family protein n=1 Tax=Terasakiella sp. SH-1 TaxID=2560057 RepID=UPI00107492B7|nr:phytanoyl-CoA dioxygenase family protein [Terasakiella sp. SH-1]
MINCFNEALVEAYNSRKKEYFAKIGSPLSSENPKVNNVVSTLKRDGLCVIENYFDHNEALSLGEMLDTWLDDLKNEKKIWEETIHHFDDIGLTRLLNAHKIEGNIKSFFEDPFIYEVAKTYACETIESRQKMLERRKPINKHGPADDYHVDEGYYHKFKAFLYLTDVSESTAPFDYYIGSHEDASWRIPKEIQMHAWETYGNEATFGWRGNCFDSREMDEIIKQNNYEHKICTAKAGTLIFVDTRGIHKATTPQTGGRLMLGNYFEVSRKKLFS